MKRELNIQNLTLKYEAIKCFVIATCLTKSSSVFKDGSLRNVAQHSCYTYTGQMRILKQVVDKMLFVSGGDTLQQPVPVYWDMGSRYRKGELLLPLDIIKRFLQVACIERIIEACRVSNIKLYMIANGKMALEALSLVVINKIAQYIIDIYRGKYAYWEYKPRKRNGKLNKALQREKFYATNKGVNIAVNNMNNIPTRSGVSSSQQRMVRIKQICRL